ncbi:MAG: MATE family efflux transporter [Firmicutes bacterium]|nr:MATE family efflux transporter [Bacillota bacterium]
MIFSNKDLKRLIVPLVIEQALAMMVGMFDTMMISSVGEAAVSGVSLVDMVNVLLINLFAALATGGTVVTSQFIGGKDRKSACDSARQLMILSLIASLLIVAAALLLRKPILRLLFGAIADDVMDNAMTYFFWSALSYPFLTIYNSGAALFRSIGNSKIPMYSSLVMNVLNIAGNALLLFVAHMGVTGVAVASLISRAAAMVIVLYLLSNRENLIYLNFRERFRIEWGMMKRILHIGIPSCLENSLFQLGRVLVVSIIATFGTIQIAANAVANSYDALGCIPGSAMNLAMITVVGQCVGAGDYPQARYYIKKLLKISYLMTFMLNLGILLSLPLTLQIYDLSAETLSLASTLVWIHDGCAILFWPIAFTLPNALRAADDVRFTMVISLFSMFTFRILLSLFLAHQYSMGAIGVWIAMVVDWIFRCICFVWRYRSGKWQKHKAAVLNTAAGNGGDFS